MNTANPLSEKLINSDILDTPITAWDISLKTGYPVGSVNSALSTLYQHSRITRDTSTKRSVWVKTKIHWIHGTPISKRTGHLGPRGEL